jgi:catechol-2,3-dioxygenase
MQILELRLNASSIQKVDDFYGNVLALNTFSVSGENNRVGMHAGKTELIFDSSPEPSIYHFAFNIPSNKIEEAYAWLKEKVELLWLDEYRSHIADFEDWNAKSVYFFDPLGNIVEFIARFDLADNASDPFSPIQIRNVSEIGIVFPQDTFEKDVKELMNNFPLEYFDKQPPMKQFRAIGDDHGLFIVVPEKRNWYPTNDKKSGIFPLSIRFVQNGREYSITT